MQSRDTSSKTRTESGINRRMNFLFKGKTYIFLTFLTIIFFDLACDNSSSPLYEPSHLKGFVLDSATLTGIENVTVSVPEFSLSTQSTSTGYFQIINIPMPRDQFGASINTVKSGYKPISQAIFFRSSDTTHVTLIIAPE